MTDTVENTPEYRRVMHARGRLIAGDRVESGEPGTQDYDTGTIVRLIIAPNREPAALVAWDSLVQTTQPLALLRPHSEGY